MIFDTDDLYEGHDRMDLLLRLKSETPAFKLTAFCVPALGTDAYWDSLPDWIECAMHGWLHPHSREAEHWTRDQIEWVLDRKPPRFVNLWKSPGWQISDATYEVLLERGWAVADHPESAHRRPAGIRYHELGQGDHVHTHVQDWGSNGLNESWDYLRDRVRRAESFEFVSETLSTAWITDEFRGEFQKMLTEARDQLEART